MEIAKAKEIIRLIAEEGKSLRGAAEIVGIPFSTANDWVNSPQYADQYACAREERATFLAEDALTVSDDQSIDPAHKRIMVDTRKWFASKLNSKRYGDKVTNEVTGKDGAPIEMIRLVAPAIEPEK